MLVDEAGACEEVADDCADDDRDAEVLEEAGVEEISEVELDGVESTVEETWLVLEVRGSTLEVDGSTLDVDEASTEVDVELSIDERVELDELVGVVDTATLEVERDAATLEVELETATLELVELLAFVDDVKLATEVVVVLETTAFLYAGLLPHWSFITNTHQPLSPILLLDSQKPTNVTKL